MPNQHSLFKIAYLLNRSVFFVHAPDRVYQLQAVCHLLVVLL